MAAEAFFQIYNKLYVINESDAENLLWGKIIKWNIDMGYIFYTIYFPSGVFISQAMDSCISRAPSKVQSEIKRFHEHDAETRVLAILALRKYKNQVFLAIPELIMLLDDNRRLTVSTRNQSDWSLKSFRASSVAEEATFSLFEIGEPAIVPLIKHYIYLGQKIIQLHEESIEVPLQREKKTKLIQNREKMIESLQHSEKIIEAMISITKYNNTEIKNISLYILRLIKNKRSFENISSFIRNCNDYKLRNLIIENLNNLRDKSDVENILNLINKSEYQDQQSTLESDFYNILNTLQLGDNYQLWSEWWKENKKDIMGRK